MPSSNIPSYKNADISSLASKYSYFARNIDGQDDVPITEIRDYDNDASFSKYPKKLGIYDLDIMDTFPDPNCNKRRTDVGKEHCPKHIFMFLKVTDLPLFIFGCVVMCVGSVCGPILTILFGKVFQNLSKYNLGEIKSFGEFLTVSRNYCFAITALGAGVSALTWIGIYVWLKIGERQSIRSRRILFKKFLDKKFEWYDLNAELNGELSQINRCIEDLRSSSSEVFGLLVQNVASIISLLVTAFVYSWSLTLVVLASAPLIALSGYFFGRSINRNAHLENQLSAKCSKILDWSLTAPQLVRLFLGKKQEIENFNKTSELSASAFFNLSLGVAANSSILKVMTQLMLVQGFWFGASMVRRGQLNVNEVFTCFSACLMAGKQFSAMTGFFANIQKGFVAADTLSKFIYDDVETEQASETPSLYPSVCSGYIKFKKINFAYPSRPEIKVLKNVTFTIPARQLVFIVGGSGSGKSTLFQLLMNSYKQFEGRIEIDGFDINNVNAKWLTDNITLVQQSCILFNDSIKNNIAMGVIEHFDNLKQVREEDIKDAVEFARLVDMLETFPEGLDTIISAKGASLSGGQIQRIALARAKIRDTPILILDEAFSALDKINRDYLMDSLRKWRQGKTTIILTHEFNQIEPTDYVYLMENGEIGEQGLKEDLMQNSGGLFSRFLNTEQTELFDVSKKERTSVLFFESSNGNESKYKCGFRDSMIKTIDSYKRLSAQFLGGLIRPNMDTDNEPDLETDIETYFENNEQNSGDSSIFSASSTYKESDDESVKTGSSYEEPSEKLMSAFQILMSMNLNLKTKVLFFSGILSSILTGVANPLFSYGFSKLLNGLVTTSTETHNSFFLLKWSVIVISIALCNGIFTFCSQYFLAYASERWILGLREASFEKINEQEISWFDETNNNPSELTQLLMNDTRDLRVLISGFSSVISNIIVLLLFAIVWTLVLGWKLSLVGLSFAPLFAIITYIYSYLLQTAENHYKVATVDIESFVHEAVNGMKTITYLRLKKHFLLNMDTKLADLKYSGTLRAFKIGLGLALSSLVTYVAEGTILYYGMRLIGLREYTSGQVLSIFTLLIFSLSTASSLLTQIPDISRGQRAGTKVIRLSNLKSSEVENKGTVIPTSNDKQLIQFKSTKFSYASRPLVSVLKDISFGITCGETVGIIGSSGSGKSTINHLITRLYSAEANAVFIDGVDVNQIDLQWLRSSISVVPQVAQFFDGSVKENLLYGLDINSKTDAEIEEVLKLSNIYDFVVSLPEGLETRLGESSNSMISGGQAQRLAIARALIRKPKILILDECTSALDPENSMIIANLVKNNLAARKELTTLVITHTEEMMKVCTRIITLKHGMITEEGSFSDLYKKGGDFFKVVNGTL